MFKSLEYSLEFSNGQTRKFQGDLQLGSTMITGRNGRGKSLILEMFSFLLFGAKALRGVASDYKKMDVVGVIAIRGTDYRISRSKSKAEIQLMDGTPIVTTTKPVNDHIEQLLGYGYDVFRISNWCAQGDIQALANMKPTERKSMIDNVAGLTQLDGLIEFVKSEIKLLKTSVTSVENAITKPLAPTAPDMDEQQIKDELDLKKIQIDQLNSLINEYNSLRVLQQPQEPAPFMPKATPEAPVALELPVKPEELPAPVLSVVEPVKPSILEQASATEILERCQAIYKDWQTLKGNADNAFQQYQSQLNRIPNADELLAVVSGTRVEYWETQNQAWQNKLQYEKLLSQGNVNCPNCGHSHPLASDALKGFDVAAFPEKQPLNLQTVNAVFALLDAKNTLDIHAQALGNKFGNAEAQQQTLANVQTTEMNVSQYTLALGRYEQAFAQCNRDVENYQTRNLERQQAWDRDCQNVVARNNERNDAWLASCKANDDLNAAMQAQYDQAKAKYQQDLEAFNVANARKAELGQKMPDYLDEQAYLNSQLESLQQMQVNWQVYHRLYQSYTDMLNSYNLAMSRVDGERAQIEDLNKAQAALVDLKARVKTYIIPSLNKVASYLLSEMTGGEHHSILVDEDFEVYVDKQPLRTMSGSGKDIANLAIRIGLGRILTHKVLGVMMLDEIDQGMDEVRAAYTWECLEKITPQIGQVLQVSHKELKAENRLVVS